MTKEEAVAFLQELKSILPRGAVERIGMFGSTVRGEATPFSDLDIFVKFNSSYLRAHDVWDYFDLLEQIRAYVRRRFAKPVDVVDEEGTTDAVLRQIRKEGIYV